MPLALLGLGWFLAPGRGERTAKALAILLFLPPLYEIFSKVAIAYHWAQLLLGIAFLGAMGLHWLSAIERPSRWWLRIAVFISVAWLIGELDGRNVYHSYRKAYCSSREFAPVMLRGRWDDACVESSRYLELAKCIRELTTEEDRVVASGGALVLFPLSGRLPPSAASADLMYLSAMKYPARHPEVIELLRREPPRLVVETLTHTFALTDYWPDFEERYRLVRTIPRDDRVHYGSFGARIWQRKE
jgi:hypothetical protein